MTNIIVAVPLNQRPEQINPSGENVITSGVAVKVFLNLDVFSLLKP
jgi:hypothetical protein